MFHIAVDAFPPFESSANIGGLTIASVWSVGVLIFAAVEWNAELLTAAARRAALSEVMKLTSGPFLLMPFSQRASWLDGLLPPSNACSWP